MQGEAIDKFYRVNDRIRSSRILLIGPDGEKIGEKGLFEAQKMADEAVLDLVEISPNSRPPVCRIMDYGKFKYEQAKQDKKQNKKEAGLKEIRLSAKIDQHDLNFKAKQATGFFSKGSQVRVSMRLVGRENIFVDRALTVFQEFANLTNLTYENPPKKNGNRIEATLTKPNDAKTENTQVNS